MISWVYFFLLQTQKGEALSVCLACDFSFYFVNVNHGCNNFIL